MAVLEDMSGDARWRKAIQVRGERRALGELYELSVRELTSARKYALRVSILEEPPGGIPAAPKNTKNLDQSELRVMVAIVR